MHSAEESFFSRSLRKFIPQDRKIIKRGYPQDSKKIPLQKTSKRKIAGELFLNFYFYFEKLSASRIVLKKPKVALYARKALHAIEGGCFGFQEKSEKVA